MQMNKIGENVTYGSRPELLFLDVFEARKNKGSK